MDDPKYAANEAKIKEYYEKARPNYEKLKNLSQTIDNYGDNIC